jgi:hypothetical protein
MRPLLPGAVLSPAVVEVAVAGAVFVFALPLELVSLPLEQTAAAVAFVLRRRVSILKAFPAAEPTAFRPPQVGLEFPTARSVGTLHSAASPVGDVRALIGAVFLLPPCRFETEATHKAHLAVYASRTGIASLLSVAERKGIPAFSAPFCYRACPHLD